MVELVLEEEYDPEDLAADGDEPRDRGEQAKPRRRGFVTLGRAPFRGDVDVWLVVGHF